MSKNRFEEMSKLKRVMIVGGLFFAIMCIIEIFSFTILSYLGLPTRLSPLPLEKRDIFTGYYNPPNRSLYTYEDDDRQSLFVRPATDRHGFSLDSNDDPDRDLTRRDNCEYRIFVMGPSTTEGRALISEDDTIPARIEKEIIKTSPSRVKVTVVNAGAGGFISAQDFNLMQFKIRYSMYPNLIIFLNGTNDFTNWPTDISFENTNTSYFQAEKNKEKDFVGLLGWFGSVLERNFSTYYALKRFSQHPQRAFNIVLSQFNEKVNKTDMVAPDNLIKKHVDRYFFNMDSAIRLSDPELKISVFFQPTLLESTPMSTQEQSMFSKRLWNRKYDYHASIAKYYKMVSRKILELNNIRNHSSFYDISDVFLNKSRAETYFSNYAHYSSKGREVITKEIMKYLKPFIEADLLRISRNCE